MDITALLLSRNPDVNYIESVDDILNYCDDLEDIENDLSFEWALKEIKGHLLNWVRVGLVAFKVKYHKLWKGHYKDFKEFCLKGLGRSLWTIKKYIDASRVVIELAKAGFEQLPHCESQARPLTKYSGDELIDKWHDVCNFMPSEKQTAKNIESIVDNKPPETKKRTIRINNELYEQLQERAAEAGLTVEQFLESLLGCPEAEEQIDESTLTEEEEQEVIKAHQCWLEDLDKLIKEDDTTQSAQPKSLRNKPQGFNTKNTHYQIE
jgi:hypothetical protein